jgi:hypothetical protein
VNCFVLILIHHQILSVFIKDAASTTGDQSEHLKNDGTPDMRFSENKDAAAAEAQVSASEGEFVSHISLRCATETSFF